MFVVSLFLAFLLTWSDVRAEPCPGTPCECTRDTNGRVVTIDCSNRGLTEVPDFTDTYNGDLDLVDFSGNNFVTFDPLGFGFGFISATSLVILDLSNNQLTSIASPFAFRNQTHQTPQYDALNLSNNNFEIFPSNAVPRESLTNTLVVIDISDNRLTSLPERFIGDHTPVRLNELRFDAKNNLIETVHPAAFTDAGISNLFLDLSGNRLASLPRDFDFPESTSNGFNMSGNPWNCDCTFRWIVGSYLRKVWRSTPPTCYDPFPIRGREIFELKPDDFVCVPEPDANATTREFNIAPGENLLECPVTADPQSTLEITWRFDLPCSDHPVTLFADSRRATINDVTCFPEANISCTASNYGGNVDIGLNVVSSSGVAPCPGGGGGGVRGGFVFLIILVVLSWIAVAGLAGYYYYLLRGCPRGGGGQTRSEQTDTVHYDNSIRTNPTRPTRPAPGPPTQHW